MKRSAPDRAIDCKALNDPEDLLGKMVKKKFGRHGWYEGEITQYEPQEK